jgi:uncharacterized protein (DUF58 family)
VPTRRGRALLIAAAGAYVLARSFAIEELYAIAFAALVFPLLAIVFVRWGRHKIGFARSIDPRRVFAGSAVRIKISARNLGRLPSPPIRLTDPAPALAGGPLRFAIPSLPPSGRDTVGVERRIAARGMHTFGPLQARLVDPFGLADVSSEVAPAAGLVVYPRIEILAESAPPEERGGGNRSLVQHLSASGDDFYAVRAWQEGDDLRKIHWRSTARTNSLMIRQEEIRPFPRATILLDNRARGHRETGRASSLEWAVSGAASVVWELARQGYALRLATADGGPGGTRWGREAIDPLLTALAMCDRSVRSSFSSIIRRAGARPGAGGALLAIMPPPTQELVPHIARLSRVYSWCGIVLLDVASFSSSSGRERAAFDQRLADVERRLARAGWRVAVAGSSDRFRPLWQTLLDAGASRPSSPSRA